VEEKVGAARGARGEALLICLLGGGDPAPSGRKDEGQRADLRVPTARLQEHDAFEADASRAHDAMPLSCPLGPRRPQTLRLPRHPLIPGHIIFLHVGIHPPRQSA
jgi:hypothetical protein